MTTLNYIDETTRYESDVPLYGKIAKAVITFVCCMGSNPAGPLHVHDASLKEISAFLLGRRYTSSYEIVKEILSVLNGTKIQCGNVSKCKLNDINNNVEQITELTKGGNDINREKDFYLYTPKRIDECECGSKEGVCELNGTCGLPYDYTAFKRQTVTKAKYLYRYYRVIVAILQQRVNGNLVTAKLINFTDGLYSMDGDDNNPVHWEDIVGRCSTAESDLKLRIVYMRGYGRNHKINLSGFMPVRETRHNLGKPSPDADTKYNCVQIGFWKLLRYFNIKFNGNDFPFKEVQKIMPKTNNNEYQNIDKIKTHLKPLEMTMKKLPGYHPGNHTKIFLMTTGIFLMNVGYRKIGDPTNRDPPKDNRHVAIYFSRERWLVDGHGTTGLSLRDLNDTEDFMEIIQNMMKSHWNADIKSFKVMEAWEIKTTSPLLSREYTKIVADYNSRRQAEIAAETVETAKSAVHSNVRIVEQRKKCSVCNKNKLKKGFSATQWKKPKSFLNRKCLLFPSCKTNANN